MKLYTEEQVLKAMNDYADTSSDLDNVINVEMAIIEQLTPIELPSDEYIDEVFQPMTELNAFYKDGFINGAKWMNEQILKNK
jgi:glutamine synthetase type III